VTGSNDVDVVVVGAGLAGLCCAHEVARAGRSVTVLEASDGVGGRVRTDLVDGFRLDRGFQILLTAYPEVAAQLDLDALRLQRFDPASRVWTGTAMQRVADPFRQPSALFDSARADVGSLIDKLRVGLLRRRVVRADAPDLLRQPDHSTLHSLRAAGFSTQMIDSFFRPLFGGIQLDTDLATSVRMFDVIFRSLAIGDAAVPADGMGAISDQLAGRLPGGTVRLHAPVAELDGTTARLADGSVVSGGALAVATEGPAAARLLGLPDPGSKPVSSIWFTGPEPPFTGRSIALDGTGRGPVANIGVLSEVAPSYAPDGRPLWICACPGVADDRDLEVDVRTQMGEWFSASVDEWEVLRVDRIAHGQPQARPPFHPKQRVDLGGGRFVAGDHRDTPSIQGAMYSGRRCGEAVLAHLAT
jgi:phytoene dehydrogenase-like protein